MTIDSETCLHLRFEPDVDDKAVLMLAEAGNRYRLSARNLQTSGRSIYK
jgi:hypothetical protein